MRARWLLVVAIVSTEWACDGVSSPSRVASGTWGGDHVTMTVGDATHLEFDCAHGDIPVPLTLDAGRFSASGTFVREHGGPILLDGPPDTHPATYSGSVVDDRMTLVVRLTDSNNVIGTFALVRGRSGRIVKCL